LRNEEGAVHAVDGQRLHARRTLPVGNHGKRTELQKEL
jgi:hypothetical protein